MTTSDAKPNDRSTPNDDRNKADKAGRDPDAAKRAPHSSATKPDAEIKPAENRDEALLDEAIMESFPASDPISPKASTIPDKPAATQKKEDANGGI